MLFKDIRKVLGINIRDVSLYENVTCFPRKHYSKIKKIEVVLVMIIEMEKLDG